VCLRVGRERRGGFLFSNYLLAQTPGVDALIFILHDGGLGNGAQRCQSGSGKR
jgi:NhaP-type Na+/H+ and K+/H+ antiporter